MIRRVIKNIATAGVAAVVLFFANLFFTAWVATTRLLPLTKNSGFVFSVPLPLPVVYAITIAVLIFISGVYFLNFVRSRILFSVTYGLILGGAVSNLYFRLTQGFVWDYFSLGLFGVSGAWNLADVGIITGIVMWFWLSRKYRRVSNC